MSVSANEVDRRVQEFTDRCRADGLKVTSQRLAIFRTLAETEEHPDAETVFNRIRKALPTVSLDTVYRTLGLLAEKGLISRVASTSTRARYDANLQHHHHFVCTQCGRVSDFVSPTMDRLPVPKSVKRLGRVERRQVQLHGVCSQCSSAPRRPEVRR